MNRHGDRADERATDRATDRTTIGRPDHPANAGAMQPGFDAFPPVERWDDWTELDAKAWPRREEHHYTVVPTTCFNCESACGLLAYVDKETGEVRKFEGNPVHPGSRGRNCAKGPATKNQTDDPERILYPLRRTGPRGGGGWERCTWDEALDDLAGRIRAAIVRGDPNRVMYHVGRPGEDGFTERVLAAWGVDGHNSHTNICSAGGRAGYAFWMGFDRPSPDYANARVILLISAHLESGHYFNPHAQRIVEARRKGARLIVLDPRLSNTASQADHWLPVWPGSEPALLLAIARHLIVTDRFDRAFVRRWVNWEEYLRAERPAAEPTFDAFVEELRRLYDRYTPEYAEAESGIPAAQVVAVAEEIAAAGPALAAHNWRASSAGVLGGWQTARCLFFLNVLTGSVGTPGGTSPNAWDKWVPRPPYMPPHPERWNELTWPREYPLAFFEMSFLLPHFLLEGRGSLDVYFTRVYNPVWTNPDGMVWVEALRREDLVGRHAALTPVWNETAWYADYVLPVGLGGERHDLHSYETHAGTWIGFRQPVTRVAAERAGRRVADTRETNPGEVWEENEFWIELSWRIDPDGSLGIRRWFEAPGRPGEKMTVDDYYGWIFEHSVPGLPEAAATEGLTPLAYMRRYGSFEIEAGVYRRHDDPVRLDGPGVVVDERSGLVFGTPPDGSSNIVPTPLLARDPEGRARLGVVVEGEARRGFPTPSGRLEFYSATLRDWGWPELAIPTHVPNQVSRERIDGPDVFALVPTFRLPVLVHTRTGNAKWLAEIAHSNPVWIHPLDAERIGVRTGDLVRVDTETGHLVNRAWVTEGIRPGVVACSHHMGRWRLAEDAGTDRWSSARVELSEPEPGRWRMRRLEGVAPFASRDPDSGRIWWRDAGVHQNLIFPVHPDPISGAHAWHQRVRLRPAESDDREGDIAVDTGASRRIYREWLALTRPAPGPGGLRRPEWLLRPLRPTPAAYRFADARPDDSREVS